MKKSAFILIIITISVFVWSCGQNNEDKIRNSTNHNKSRAKRVKKKKMTIEKYSKVNNETRKLLMEKYWPKFKGKKYNEVKDLFTQYKEEKKDIYSKYKIDKKSSLHYFFKRNFKEIYKYEAKDSEYKKYPEYSNAAKVVIDFTMKSYGK
jgi:hypothetical protein